MAFYHGIRTNQIPTSVSTPVTGGSGIPFVVGTAPGHTVGGKVNEPVLCNSYAEAAAAFGYSDDWGKYSLCEVMDAHFKLYGMSPVVMVNVLDPEKHKKAVDADDLPLVAGRLELPYEAVTGSVKVQNGGSACTPGEDYELFYADGKLVLEVVEGGAIGAGVSQLNIAYDMVDTSKVTKAEIIGGFDPATKKSSGFELLDRVFPKYRIAPDLLLAPGWSSDSEVAAIMSAKAENINGLFGAKALIDADCKTVRYYSDVTAWKSDKNINSRTQILCWPMVALGDKRYHMSVHLAGMMAKVDAANGDCPCESPSNKMMQIDATVLADGEEVALDLTQANYLNSVGVASALNSITGFVPWGNSTACYPGNTDPKDYFIPMSRMFDWVAKSVILSYWSKVDQKMNRRLVGGIMDSTNIWLAGLTAEEKLLGARVEFLDEENPDTDLLAGILKFHIYMAPPPPAQEINYSLEYDVSYVAPALVG